MSSVNAEQSRGCAESSAVETGGKNTASYPQKHMFTDMNLYRPGFSWLDKETDGHTQTHTDTHTHTP